jgi:hypothetical protein
MKYCILATITFLGVFRTAFAQNINWRSIQTDQNHIISLQTGFDYGFTTGIGYGYRLKTPKPILLNVEYSFPAGDHPFDDFKTRIGGQMEVFQFNGFSATVKAYCPFRRFENRQTRLVNFGGEFSGVVGYYKPKWFISGEFGLDKAIITHIKQSEEARKNGPSLQNGWYIPTGGNYFYGLQSGFSFGKNDISLKAGRIVSQGFKTRPLIPFYAELGYNRRF